MTPIARRPGFQDSVGCAGDRAKGGRDQAHVAEERQDQQIEKSPSSGHGKHTAQSPRSIAEIRKPLGKSQKHTASKAPPRAA